MTSDRSLPVLDPTGADIHGELARLRTHGPAVRVELPGGVPAWLVTDHALLRRLVLDPQISKDPRDWAALTAGDIPQDWVLAPWISVRNMLATSGVEHQRLRRAVAPAFTDRRIRELRPRIAAATQALLDEMAGADGDIVDVRASFARPLPIRVITALMGVPPELAAPLCVHADGILDTTATAEQVGADYVAMMSLVAELVSVKSAHPGEDLTTILLQGPDGTGPRLNRQELIDTCGLIIAAGHETTVNLLDHAVVALLTRPEMAAEVFAGRIGWAAVIEEALRAEAPIANMPFRFALDDIDLDGGIRIERGEAILVSFAAANRDPAVYGDTAGDFDPARTTKGHFAFGHGAHFCLGAPLARLEAQVALPALFDRFPGMRLATDTIGLGHVPSCIMHGHHRVPVHLHPWRQP